MLHLILIHTILFLSHFSVAAPERIVWNKPHWPPYYIAEGPKAGKGHLDQLLSLIEKQTPDFTFNSVHSEIEQLDYRSNSLERTCNGAVLRTKEREKKAYLSAFYLQPPVQIIMRTSDWKKIFFEAKVISLKQLFESPLRGAFAAGRSYGETLDTLINGQQKNSKISRIPRSQSLSLVSMVDLQRVDYTLEYAEVFRYMQNEKLLSTPMVSVEVEEQRTPYVVYISCPKNEWGKHVIRMLDKTMQKIAATEEFRSLTEKWYSSEIKTRYRHDFDDFYKRRSSGEWTTVPSDKK
ncbi:MAG: TIGR02285 family protein [Bdellovibrio sp.]